MKKNENVQRDVRAVYPNGEYILKLGNLLLDHDKSINELMRAENLAFNVIKKYLTGEIQRIDLSVIDRICKFFDCRDIREVIEYRSFSTEKDEIKS